MKNATYKKTLDQISNDIGRGSLIPAMTSLLELTTALLARVDALEAKPAFTVTPSRREEEVVNAVSQEAPKTCTPCEVPSDGDLSKFGLDPDHVSEEAKTRRRKKD